MSAPLAKENADQKFMRMALESAQRGQGWVEPNQNGDHYFMLQGYGGYRLFIDDEQVMDKWFELRGWMVPTTEWVKVNLTAGKKVRVKLEYAKMQHSVEIRLGWFSPVQFEAREALALAEKSDVAVVCVGWTAAH